MPLRVTKEYSDDNRKDKKVHRKMSKNGHFQKVRRPTGLEVYNDAAKILEELLEKRIDHNVKTNLRQRRNQTDPTKEKYSVVRESTEISVARCKTMPSRYRESIDDDARKKEISEKVIEALKKKKKRHFGDDSDSSANVTEADTDDEDEGGYGKNRKKKSMFKRAKENLLRTFQRDQKDVLGKKDSNSKDEDTNSLKKRKLKLKKKEKDESVVKESKRNVKVHMNKDKSIDYSEVLDSHHKDPSSQTELVSRKKRSGSISRNSLVDAIRKPFRKSLHKKNEVETDDKKIAELEERNKSLSLKDDDSSASPRSASTPHHESTTPSSPLGPPPPPLPASSQLYNSTANNTARQGLDDALSSSASTQYPYSEYNNSVGSLLSTHHTNILDSPGDDIPFMDEEEKRRSWMKFHGSEGLLNLQWLADQTANAKSLDVEIDEHSVSTRLPDGDVETTTTVTAIRTMVVPEAGDDESRKEGSEDGEKEDNVQGPEREELYGKIAQKLIEMADTYGTDLSDAEGRAVQDDAAIIDAPLTDLEKEIIACLRSGGDKYGKKMEDQMDAMKQAVAEDAYDRFRSTINNSMGAEVSWNTIALLFYATKGVVSAVGKSSQVAVQAKEFTLKYISDTFVGWIMEQGGFDSMLSESESDPNLD